MKKLFLLSMLLIPLAMQANNNWHAFSVTNDTKHSKYFAVDSKFKKLKPGQTYHIINSKFANNPSVLEKYKNKITLEPKDNKFKITKTKPIYPARTFIGGPIINLKPGNSANLTVSSILDTKKELPKGFEYRKYSWGLMPEEYFFIKNNTNHNVRFIYKNTHNSIKPNEKLKVNEVSANKEFKIEVTIRGFKGNQSGRGFREDKIHIFSLKRNYGFKKETILEIKKLLSLKDSGIKKLKGFDIKKQETQNMQF